MKAFLTLAALTAFAGEALCDKPFICYWESWSRYRPAPYQHSVDKIPTNLCTHIIYSFAGLDDATWKIKALEEWWDIGSGGFKQLVGLKQKNPNLKVSVAVGGWNEGVSKYSKMVADAGRRKIFIDSVIDWIKTYGFDGFDLDWEYPGDLERGGSPADKDNLNLFLKEMRDALDKLGKKLLTIAVFTPLEKVRSHYDVPQVAKYCDYIHAMAYDLKGGWDRITGNHVTLYSGAADQGIHKQLSVSQGMKNWVDLGAPKSKMIMGLAFYGKSFTLSDPSNNGLRAPATGDGSPGTISQQAGTLFYFEICERLKQGWTRKFDNEGKAPYAYSGNQWVGYDDPEGLKYKMDLLNKEGYGGAMVWAIGLDDHANVCGQGAYPLANAAVKALNGGSNNGGNDTPTTVSPTTSAPNPQPTPSPNPGPNPGPNPAPVTCSSGSSHIPHNRYCNKYFVCVGTNTIEQSCPSGLVWDQRNTICNWDAAVNPKTPAGCTNA